MESVLALLSDSILDYGYFTMDEINFILISELNLDYNFIWNLKFCLNAGVQHGIFPANRVNIVALMPGFLASVAMVMTRHCIPCTGIILSMGSANERRRYNVTSSLIGWAHTQNGPWCSDIIPSDFIGLHSFNIEKFYKIQVHICVPSKPFQWLSARLQYLHC